MSEQTQEPTMEEILASIRRIISEDDAPSPAEPETAAAPAAAPEPAPEPVAEAEPEPEPMTAEEVEAQIEEEEEEEILELTQRVEEPAETHGDLDVFAKEEPAPPPPPAPEPSPVVAPVAREALVSTPAASAAASAFGRLTAAVQMPPDGTTLEHVVRELLTPLLAAWLDENLPAIVQAKVDEEVERIARGRVR